MKIKEKPITRKVMDEVLRITEKAMMYNNTPTKQEFTGDKPTFFVELSGHIGNILVDCHTGGYVAKNEYETEEEILADLNRVLADMDRFYNDWLSRQEAAPDV